MPLVPFLRSPAFSPAPKMRITSSPTPSTATPLSGTWWPKPAMSTTETPATRCQRGSEVKSVTLHGTDYPETGGHIHIPVTEHCAQEEVDEVYVDGLTTKPDFKLSQYANYSYAVVTGKIEKIIPKGSLVVPPSARVSAIMRDSLSKMIKGIQADKILEEHVEVSTIELYYRPIYAFKYQWISKGKEGILELDGVTGTISSGSRVFTEYLGKALDQDFLFDIGADAAGMLVPGGSIAVKAARKYMSKK